MDPQPALVATGSTGRLLHSGRVLASLADWHLANVSKIRGWNFSATATIKNEYWFAQCLEEPCTLELQVNSKLWIFKDARIELIGTLLYARGFDKPEVR